MTSDWLERLDADWLDRLDAAVFYRTVHGKWPAGSDEDPEVRSLGVWVNTHRSHGKKFVAGEPSRLDQERYDLLNSTPGWVWDEQAAAWDRGYRAAVKYFTAHGEWPSTHSEDPEVEKIGVWVKYQRSYGKKLAAGKTSRMTRERYDRLESTPGWVWSRNHPAVPVWETDAES